MGGNIGKMLTQPDFFVMDKISPGFSTSDVGKVVMSGNSGLVGTANAFGGKEARDAGVAGNIAITSAITGGAAAPLFGGAAPAAGGSMAGAAGGVGSGAATGVGAGMAGAAPIASTAGTTAASGASWGAQALPYIQGAGQIAGGYGQLSQKTPAPGMATPQLSQPNIPMAQLSLPQGGNDNGGLMELLKLLSGGR